MNDELTRENQIKKITLLNQLISPYLTATSITIAILFFIITNTTQSSFARYGFLILLLVFLGFLYWTYQKQVKEIDNAFK